MCGVTMKNDEYICRLAFEITEEQQKRTNKNFPYYGMKRAVFSRILDEVNDIIETCGPGALGLLISGKVKAKEIIPIMAAAEEEGKDG
jgi:hypothetical protein